MQAYEIEVTIPNNHWVQLPDYVPEGYAKLVVLTSASVPTAQEKMNEIGAFLQWLQAQPPPKTNMSGIEIDAWVRDLREDRDLP